MDQNTIETLARAWDDIITTPEVEECRYDHMGLWQVEFDGCTYAIGTEEDAEQAAADCIRDNLWSFRPGFLADYAPDGVDADMIRHMIGVRCESANDQVARLVGDRIDSLIEDAIAADGIGHFLSSYDGKHREATSPAGDRLVIVRVY